MWRLTENFNILCKREGWAIFDTGGSLQICHIDDLEGVADEIGELVPELASDEEAMSLVISKALEGSKLHAFALYLAEQPSGDAEVPREFQEFCIRSPSITSVEYDPEEGSFTRSRCRKANLKKGELA